MNRGVITISKSGTVSMPTDTVWMTMQEIADMGLFAPANAQTFEPFPEDESVKKKKKKRRRGFSL